ncbi:MAG TPA: RNA-binding cell elongation regulator Jag/EloR [Spirochaetia bacterium]|nr:RNA-binding cell elongation regulator Jag/EloR [Spirochaetales bacterium]HRS64488.1 RNA-binding cell elongation regulator Jag/EloR [Spirochaetia bacterium]HOT58207.1 RNA-binding cell elongation regulator Jag/EloR [Spirochaetales bacterium]HPD81102.1 RNA-binding cell elongation regulator Jag/EloR [Spirochaetales bacterium]HQG39982.1 RNA-binding cell elongation regulator Jag/EloR [Spirochaetales bacterium]
MVHEFEGKTEEEAIENAVSALGVERDKFDVEILETTKGSFLKKAKTRIRVYLHDDEKKEVSASKLLPEHEEKIIDFVQKLIEHMGYNCKASILFREEKKLGVRLESPNVSIIIGKKGKNLDAIQSLLNVYASKIGLANYKIVVDAENYRLRREESLVKMAYELAEKVRKTRTSILLEPMNPFERRIIHTTLNNIVDIETKSEGEGLYKQVRIMFRGKI